MCSDPRRWPHSFVGFGAHGSEERLVEPRPSFRYFILRLVLGGRHDVLGHNGIDGCVSASGNLFRVDGLEGRDRKNAARGRCPGAPANDVAASAGFQHPINRRPADHPGFRDLRGSPCPPPSLRSPGRHLSRRGGRCRRQQLWAMPFVRRTSTSGWNAAVPHTRRLALTIRN
jgi:hypothetical protein